MQRLALASRTSWVDGWIRAASDWPPPPPRNGNCKHASGNQLDSGDPDRESSLGKTLILWTRPFLENLPRQRTHACHLTDSQRRRPTRRFSPDQPGLCARRKCPSLHTTGLRLRGGSLWDETHPRLSWGRLGMQTFAAFPQRRTDGCPAGPRAQLEACRVKAEAT